jgi:hypothetical protein
VAWRVALDETSPYVSAVLDLWGIGPNDFSSASGITNATDGVALVAGMNQVLIYDETGCVIGETSTAVNWAVSLEHDGGLPVGGPVSLGPLCGGPPSWAQGINDEGVSFGVSGAADGGLCGFLNKGQLQQLSSMRRSNFDRQSVRDVNDAATTQAVGHLENIRTGAWFAVVCTERSSAALESVVTDILQQSGRRSRDQYER